MLGRRVHHGLAPFDPLHEHLDGLFVPAERQQRASAPRIRLRIVGISVDRAAALLDCLFVPVRQRKRRSVTRAERHLPRVVPHCILVVPHDALPVAAARSGERAPHAGAHCDVVGIYGGRLLVAPDGLLVAPRLQQQLGHAENGRHVLRVGVGRLHVGSLGLCMQADARKGVAPVRHGPQVALSSPRLQVAVAHLKGPAGRPARAVSQAGRIHYGRLDKVERRQVPRTAGQDAAHEPLDGAQVRALVEPDHAQGVDKAVPQVEQAGKVAAHFFQARLKRGRAVLVGQAPDCGDALKPVPERLDAGRADLEGARDALDHHRRRTEPAVLCVQPLLENQPQELLQGGDGLHDDGRLQDGVARSDPDLQLRHDHEDVEHAQADHRQRDRVLEAHAAHVVVVPALPNHQILRHSGVI